jgi:hypothetical protein
VVETARLACLRDSLIKYVIQRELIRCRRAGWDLWLPPHRAARCHHKEDLQNFE